MCFQVLGGFAENTFLVFSFYPVIILFGVLQSEGDYVSERLILSCAETWLINNQTDWQLLDSDEIIEFYGNLGNPFGIIRKVKVQADLMD